MTATPIRPPSNPKLLTNMKVYWQSVDWMGAWETFRDAKGTTGLPLYKTVKQFIEQHLYPLNGAQREFLEWYLGPDLGNKVLTEKYMFASCPLDWWDKRENGGSCWWNDETKLAVERKIKAQVNALDFMREHSNETMVGQSASLSRLATEIFKAIGPVLRDDLTEDQNRDRVKKWLDLFKDVTRLQSVTQEMILKSLGLDAAQAEGVATLIIQTAVAGRNTDSESDRIRRGIFDQAYEMTHVKAQQMRSDLPAGFPRVTYEATSTPVDDAKPQGKNGNIQ